MNMNGPGSSGIPTQKSIWKRLETWALLIFIIACGFLAGWSVSQYYVWKQAKVQFDQLALDYDESAKTRSAILKMCLSQTKEAADAAKEAVDKAVGGSSK